MLVQVPFRSSSFIKNLMVNPIMGEAVVKMKDGYEYSYSNISRRACLNILVNPSMSLGFWTNKNCINNELAIIEDCVFA